MSVPTVSPQNAHGVQNEAEKGNNDNIVKDKHKHKDNVVNVKENNYNIVKESLKISKIRKVITEDWK